MRQARQKSLKYDNDCWETPTKKEDKLKRKLVIYMLAAVTILGASGCSGDDPSTAATEVTTETTTEIAAKEKESANKEEKKIITLGKDKKAVNDQKIEESKNEDAEDNVSEDVIDESMYYSELTGLPVSKDIENQRPIAVMVDNDERALKHYGISEADVVYEMMNSTVNNRITRLMCVYKDWQNIDQIGSIRSTRSTNPMLAAEWNAVLIHDGGPYYINTYLSQPWARHLSGSFTRIKNGKATEFTEYVVAGEAASRINKAGYSISYDDYKDKDETHFNFGKVNLSYGVSVADIKLPFPHNGSELKYNAKTNTYDYYEYGEIHKDAEDDEVLSFTNVILQDVTFSQLDENGYLIYNVIGEGNGYYITGGYAIPIFWRKASETDITRFYNSDNEEITINAGKTYIGLVPDDSWDQLSIN